jgi:hypothetical protein
MRLFVPPPPHPALAPNVRSPCLPGRTSMHLQTQKSARCLPRPAHRSPSRHPQAMPGPPPPGTAVPKPPHRCDHAPPELLVPQPLHRPGPHPWPGLPWLGAEPSPAPWPTQGAARSGECHAGRQPCRQHQRGSRPSAVRGVLAHCGTSRAVHHPGPPAPMRNCGVRNCGVRWFQGCDVSRWTRMGSPHAKDLTFIKGLRPVGWCSGSPPSPLTPMPHGLGWDAVASQVRPWPVGPFPSPPCSSLPTRSPQLLCPTCLPAIRPQISKERLQPRKRWRPHSLQQGCLDYCAACISCLPMWRDGENRGNLGCARKAAMTAHPSLASTYPSEECGGLVQLDAQHAYAHWLHALFLG